MRFKIVIVSLSVIAMMILASCEKSAPSENNKMNQGVTTEEKLPEYTMTESEGETGTEQEGPNATSEINASDAGKETEESKDASDKEKVKDQEDDTGFSGLDVKESTEIILDEGQDIMVD